MKLELHDVLGDVGLERGAVVGELGERVHGHVAAFREGGGRRLRRSRCPGNRLGLKSRSRLILGAHRWNRNQDTKLNVKNIKI